MNERNSRFRPCNKTYLKMRNGERYLERKDLKRLRKPSFRFLACKAACNYLHWIKVFIRIQCTDRQHIMPFCFYFQLSLTWVCFRVFLHWATLWGDVLCAESSLVLCDQVSEYQEMIFKLHYGWFCYHDLKETNAIFGVASWCETSSGPTLQKKRPILEE